MIILFLKTDNTSSVMIWHCFDAATQILQYLFAFNDLEKP